MANTRTGGMELAEAEEQAKFEIGKVHRAGLPGPGCCAEELGACPSASVHESSEQLPRCVRGSVEGSREAREETNGLEKGRGQ